MRRIEVDLNRRTASGLTPARYFGPTPEIGEDVIAFESEDGVRVRATVTEVNCDRGLVYLDVDWDSMEEDLLAPAVTSVSGTAASGGGMTTNTNISRISRSRMNRPQRPSSSRSSLS